MAVSIYIQGTTLSAHLRAWGRPSTGASWWGLITWRQRIIVPSAPTREELDCAAWAPADRINQPNWSRQPATDLPRIALPPSHHGWPAPPGWDGYFAGPWPAGPVPVPPGVTVAKGPAWRDRLG